MHGPTTETSARSWAAVPCAAHAAVTARTPSYRYAWPVKPFREQHPVRGFFGDPRIANLGRSRQFHFGVDVSAPDGTPVYATLTGLIRIHPLHATTVLIDGAGGLEFEYWHIVPTVRTGQRAVAYRTVIGRIEAPYAHVHFSEARNGRYLNPLRPGAMGPFVDHTKPEVAAILAERAGRVLQSSSIRGAFDLVAEVRDETPMAIPRPWHDLPVTPALVRWRLLRQGRVVLGWQTAIDFRETIPPAYEFDRTWAPGTTQNHVRLPGRYRVFLSNALGAMRVGPYVVQVAVRDTRRNAATVSVRLTIGSAVS
jgi:Peptidase family M23